MNRPQPAAAADRAAGGGYRFRLNGAAVEAHPSGALWWPAERLLAVADLHLEKGAAFAEAGVHLPPYDTIATLERLAAAIAALKPAIVVTLGDNYHTAGGASRLHPAAAELLARLAAMAEWVWLDGNHDLATPFDDATDPRLTRLERAGLVFRHHPTPGQAGEVAGHLHPKVRLATRARRFSLPCLVTDGAQVVLPAFGAFTGGLPAGAAAVRRLFRGRPVALACGGGRVVPVAL